MLFHIRFRTSLRYVFIYYKEKKLFICGISSSAKMRFFFIHLHVSLGHLLVKLHGLNLTPPVYNAAFFISS